MSWIKMGTTRGLASCLTSAIAVSVLVAATSTQEAKAAIYTPTSFFVTGSLSFDVINPNDLNNMSGGTAPLPGLIGGRLQFERGLFKPSWSHWIELDYFTGSSSASGSSGNYSLSLSYLAILPIGVTYWFARTAYIDFGVALGAGIGLAPSYTFTSSPGSNPTASTTTNYTGNLGPLAIGRIEARFWFSQYFGATFATGLHVFSSPLNASGVGSVNGALSGLSMIGGLTYAFGGVKRGRTYVEVIHDKPDANKKPGVPSPAPKPLKRAVPAPVPTPAVTAQPLTAEPTK